MKNILKHASIVLIFMVGFTSCSKDDIDMSQIDFSNIENLHAQPLPVIKQCVQGKWQWVSISQWGIRGYLKPANTFAEITESNVAITQTQRGDNQWLDISPDCLGTFYYKWEKRKTLADYSTYVMWDNKKNNGWYFEKIQNDTLFVFCDDVSISYASRYLFVKTK